MTLDVSPDTGGTHWPRTAGTIMLILGLLLLPGALWQAAAATHFLINASAYADHVGGHEDQYLNAYYEDPLGVAPLRLVKSTLYVLPIWLGLLLKRGTSRRAWRDLVLLLFCFLVMALLLSGPVGRGIGMSSGSFCRSNVRLLLEAMKAYATDRP